MSKGLVLLGDKTTHGGSVISASSTMFIQGKRWRFWGTWSVARYHSMVLILLLKVRQNGFLMVNR